ncbi:MAG: peptidylprolyl isomerase [Candidatus Shapirobacteria bacterium]|nr:peptidylprolyl isomerase [Candidatus Shapirobacteria bacterium]
MKKVNLVLVIGFLGLLMVLGIIYRPRGKRIPCQDNFPDEASSGLDQLVLPEDNIEIAEQEMIDSKKQTSWSLPPALIIDSGQDYQATLTTSVGEITIDLFEKNTPQTVNNFVFLAQEGFYEGIIFHRVIEDFMVQGGCPRGDGSGGPGYQFADEPFSGQYVRGTVAMANAGPNTNGSQFFIMHQSQSLPANYVIFGQVTEGMEVVDKIATAPVKTGSGGEVSSPVNPVTITRVDIFVK